MRRTPALCRFAEGQRDGPVPFPKGLPRRHGVDQVIRGVDVSKSVHGVVGILEIPADDFHARPVLSLEAIGIPGDTAQLMTFRQQPWNQPAADVSRGAGDEHAHLLHAGFYTDRVSDAASLTRRDSRSYPAS